MGILSRLRGSKDEPKKAGEPPLVVTATWVPAAPRPRQPTPPFENRRGELPVDGFRLKGQGRVKPATVRPYQAARGEAAGVRTATGVNVGVLASLVPEPGNQHDKHAVRVVVGGQTVGYLSRLDARAYRLVIDKVAADGKVAYCNATIRGGWDRGNGDVGSYGIDLDLAAPEHQ